MAITSLSELRAHVRWAIQLEQSTIPPYLYAYYSFREAGTEREPEAAKVIRDVAVEEMLHLSLACNVYSALGGEDLDLTDPRYFPTYPSTLPHHRNPPVTLRLERASLPLIEDLFLRIEKPEAVGAIPEGDQYGTIGQFYRAIQIALEEIDEFPGDPRRQVTHLFGYGGGKHGHLVRVIDLYSASLAIREIVEQGEGSAHTEYNQDGGLAHFWRFSQIVEGTVPFRESAVYPVVANPLIAELPSGPIQDLGQLFADCYSLLLRALSRIYNTGNESELAQHGAIYTLMDRALKPVASTLVQTPIPGADANAGPSFERSEATHDEVIRRAWALAEVYPQLVQVPRALEGLPEIDS